MEFDNSFEVPLPPAQAWTLLMDVERIAPCMPGAKLTEVVDAKTYKGNIAVRLGPVALTFAGTVVFEALDEASRTARVRAQGTDAKGRGGAHVVSTFRLEPSTDGSKIFVHTDLSLSGAVAQYGRGVGMIQSTAAQLMKQFATALRAQVIERAGMEPPGGAAEAAAPPPRAAGAAPPLHPPSAAARPISGLSLLARVIWDAIVRRFTRRSERG
ncbi:MAG: SRPBCC family protein [Xanthobacteraceae bacterium]